MRGEVEKSLAGRFSTLLILHYIIFVYRETYKTDFSLFIVFLNILIYII
jgi:hypothetical protein